jgi:hypothetical protein
LEGAAITKFSALITASYDTIRRRSSYRRRHGSHETDDVQLRYMVSNSREEAYPNLAVVSKMAQQHPRASHDQNEAYYKAPCRHAHRERPPRMVREGIPAGARIHRSGEWEIWTRKGPGLLALRVKKSWSQSGLKKMYVGVPENRLSLTVIESISADGKAIPPVVIVPGGTIIESWFHENMTGHEVVAVSPSGYTNKEICRRWLDHFIKHNDCGPDQPWRILLMDGATCHEALYDAAELAQQEWNESRSENPADFTDIPIDPTILAYGERQFQVQQRPLDQVVVQVDSEEDEEAGSDVELPPPPLHRLDCGKRGFCRF